MVTRIYAQYHLSLHLLHLYPVDVKLSDIKSPDSEREGIGFNPNQERRSFLWWFTSDKTMCLFSCSSEGSCEKLSVTFWYKKLLILNLGTLVSYTHDRRMILSVFKAVWKNVVSSRDRINSYKMIYLIWKMYNRNSVIVHVCFANYRHASG